MTNSDDGKTKEELEKEIEILKLKLEIAELKQKLAEKENRIPNISKYDDWDWWKDTPYYKKDKIWL